MRTAYKDGETSHCEDGLAEVSHHGRKRSHRASSVSSTDGKGPSTRRGGAKMVYGPTMPSESDLLLRREELESDSHRAMEQRQLQRHVQSKQDRKEERARVEDLAPKGDAGKDRRMQLKKDKKEQMRGFREPSAELQINESELYGDGESFRAKMARQEEAQQRKKDNRYDFELEKDAALRERRQAAQSKEEKIMEMLRRLARARYGADVHT